MTIFWSRSLKGVHGTWKTPGFAFLAPLLVELQPTLGVIFGIIAVFRGPHRGTWGPHGRPLALSLPFGMSRPGLAPIWSQFNPGARPVGGPKTVKIVICDKTPFFSKSALFGARDRTTTPPGHGAVPIHRPSRQGRVWAESHYNIPPNAHNGLYSLSSMCTVVLLSGCCGL